MNIEIKRLQKHHPENPLPLPAYASAGAAGFDLQAHVDLPITLEPGERYLVPSGIAINLGDSNLVAKMYVRSSIGHKHGIVLSNGTGIIDSDYQGPIGMSLFNTSDKPFTIERGDRIAQLVITPVIQVTLKECRSFSDVTERGENGFGSTGN